MKLWNKSFIFALVLLTMASTAGAEEDEIPTNKLTKENTSIKAVMKGAHKKPHELLKKTALGKATKKEQQRLLALYKIMAKHAPTKGDAKAWKTKTDLLVKATEAVIAGKPDAKKMLSRASNCKSCHSAHKPQGPQAVAP